MTEDTRGYAVLLDTGGAEISDRVNGTLRSTFDGIEGTLEFIPDDGSTQTHFAVHPPVAVASFGIFDADGELLVTKTMPSGDAVSVDWAPNG